MPKFEIRYALSGGFGGVENKDWEEADANTKEQAEIEAYEKTCEEYEQYDGMHGLRDVEMIMEEDEVNKEEAYEIWKEEREGWLDYESREVNDTNCEVEKE